MLAVFDRIHLRDDSDERHLGEVAANVPPGEWADEQVQTLVRILMRSQRMYYREFHHRDLLEELARMHPGAAIAGAREGAPDDVNWNDLSFLQRIPRERLRQETDGKLEAPLAMLLEILELREVQADAPPTPERPPTPQPPTLAEALR